MSQIKANDITNVTGGIPTVKSQQLIPTAWVNFNGQNTVAIRGSENVSSITDAATGDYVINFTAALANTNYCALFSCADAALYVAAGRDGNSFNTVGSTRAGFRNSSSQQWYDPSVCYVAILGGQA
tara:strand:+ start:221 stop:598 length:378 start_codon:yes stop_codon:yes gene_type:complete